MNVRQPYMDFLMGIPVAGEWVNQPTRQRAVVLVDNRDDEIIDRVVASYQRHLGEDWNFYRVSPKGDFGPAKFSRMLLRPSFWERFTEDILLIIQGDTVCLRPLDKRFEQYDMIGAPCGNIFGNHDFTMNGGLSLRHRKTMRFLAREAYDSVPEDVFFSANLRPRRFVNLPNLKTACEFSVESEPCYVAPPFGVHGTDKMYHSDALAEQMVADALREYPWS